MRLNKITYKNKKLLNSSIQRNIFHSHFDIYFNYFVKNKLSINFQFQILKFLINLHSNKIRLIIFFKSLQKTFINKIFIIIVFVSIKSFYSILVFYLKLIINGNTLIKTISYDRSFSLWKGYSEKLV